MQRRIDAHQHFWIVDRADYPWMPEDGLLHKDYLPPDLVALNRAAGIDGTVLVQAAPTVAETEFMLSLSEQADSQILGVVGWVPLDSADGARDMERLVAHPKMRGLRPMIQDLPDDRWILQPQVMENLRQMPRLGLRFDVVTFPRHLPAVFEALQQLPELDFVIDHLSKPRYREGIEADGWRHWMRRFAELPRAHCKLSGMVTEVGAGWSVDDFRAHTDVILEAFGPERVMFGSDWPVCLLAATHAEVVGLAEQLTASLSAGERAAVWGVTAERFYGLQHTSETA